MNEKVPFASECPKCGHDRVLTGYGSDELAELLTSGADIEGYCISCDERWPISTDERADLGVRMEKRQCCALEAGQETCV